MKSIVFSLALVSMTISSFAQGMWGVNFKKYQPTGTFGENINTSATGLSINYLHHIPNSKFTVGAELGIAMYANNEYQYELSSGRLIDVYEEDCFWTVHADARYFFYEVHALKAYAQGRLGVTTFFSSKQTIEPTPELPETFRFHGTAFNLGLGGGVLINFTGIFNKEKQGLVNLDLGFSIHSGTSAHYRYMEQDSRHSGLDAGNYTSLTNYIDYRIGLIFNPKWRGN